MTVAESPVAESSLTGSSQAALPIAGSAVVAASPEINTASDAVVALDAATNADESPQEPANLGETQDAPQPVDMPKSPGDPKLADDDDKDGDSTKEKEADEEEVDDADTDVGIEEDDDDNGFGDDLDDDEDLDEFEDIDEDDFDDGFDDDFEEELGDDYEIEIDDEISEEFGLNTGPPKEEDPEHGLGKFDDFDNLYR